MERRRFLHNAAALGATTLAGASITIAEAATPADQSSQKRDTVMISSQTPYVPLTADNAALILIDHQVGLMTGVRDYTTGELKHIETQCRCFG